MITSGLGIVVLLGGLIFFHELGHYSVAKLFGVRVEVFSLGFGKKIFKKIIGETEYTISLIPLGGYVKLMGDDPYKEVRPEDANRAFSTQKLYKRFLIVAAGPMANLLLAYVLFIGIFWAGIPQLASVVGTVMIGGPVWDAGLRPADRIVEIQGKPVTQFSEVEAITSNLVGQDARVVVDRGGKLETLTLPVTLVTKKNEFGEEVRAGGFSGVDPKAYGPIIGVSHDKSAAGSAGLKTGDIITKVNATQINSFSDLESAIASAIAEKKPFVVSVERSPGESAQPQLFTIAVPSSRPVEKTEGFPATASLGMFPGDVFIRELTPDSPAQKGGLLPGDRIVKLGNMPAYHFENIVEYVGEQGKKNTPVDLTIERSGEVMKFSLTPISVEREDPVTREKYSQFMIGFAPHLAYSPLNTVGVRYRNPFQLIPKAISECNQMAWKMLVGVGKLLLGQVSVKNLGGPVFIAKLAGRSLHEGIIPFLQMMALISINLFLLNLFPIPVLDGGHLLFFAIEAIQRRPVSIRTMEVANQAGMVFILFLVGLTLFNDITRMVLN